MKVRSHYIPQLALLLVFALPAIITKSVVRADDAPADPAKYSDQWRPTGPPGGDVRGLVVDPNNADRFYFGTLDGQIYTSADAGKHWELRYNFNRPKLFVDHIIVDPRDSNTLYVACHRHKEAGGFFKSTDGGRSFKENPALRNEALHSLTQSQSDPNVLVAGTFNGIFRSDDAGDTWQQLPTSSTPGLEHVESLAIDPRSANIIYAGTWYLPYKTTDGGKTWKSIKEGIIDDSDIFAIDIDPRDPNHVIASACSGIYETKNAGDNWRKVQGIPSQSRRTRAILQHPSVPGLVFAGTTEGFWRSEHGGDADSWMVTTSRQLEINSIAVHPTRPETVYIGTNNYGVMVSFDSGKSFVPTNAGYSGRFANSIVPDRENPSRIYAATINTTTGGGFLFVSTDSGETWRPSMRNMPSRVITYSILQDSEDVNTIYLGTNLGVYRSVDRGLSWAPVWAQEPDPDAAVKAKKRTPKRAPKRTVSATTLSKPKVLQADETVLQAQQALSALGYHPGEFDGIPGPQTFGAVKKFQADRHLLQSGALDQLTLAALGLSTNGVPASEQLLVLTDAVNELIPTVSEDGKRGLLAASNIGLFISFDPTKGWRKLPYGSNFDSRTTCVVSNLKQPQKIWVGTASSGVLFSRDGGTTWEQAKDIPDDVTVNAIAQDPVKLDYIYVGTKRTFYVSHDGGRTFDRRGGNLPFGDFTSILINPRNTEEIFIGNAYQTTDVGGGVFRTLNGGVTWARIDPKEHRLPSQRIWALAFDSRDQNLLYVGSHSAGVYVVPRNGEALSSSQ